jgi:hypothetical protein
MPREKAAKAAKAVKVSLRECHALYAPVVRRDRLIITGLVAALIAIAGARAFGV